nr:polysaccharide biosynthesis protein [Priestia megaterium]
MFNNKTILVTGGTGSWGYELVKQLLTHNPKEGYDRDTCKKGS